MMNFDDMGIPSGNFTFSRTPPQSKEDFKEAMDRAVVLLKKQEESLPEVVKWQEQAIIEIAVFANQQRERADKAEAERDEFEGLLKDADARALSNYDEAEKLKAEVEWLYHKLDHWVCQVNHPVVLKEIQELREQRMKAQKEGK